MRKLAPLIALLCACAQPPPTTGAPDAVRSSTDRALESAAAEYAVPVEVLKGIAWVESRFLPREGERSGDGGFGLMHLTDGEGGSLAQAAALTGLSRDALRADVLSNARGGAALLRQIADRTFGDTPNLNPAALGDWFPVVMRYPETDDARLAESYAFDVFAAITNGQKRALGDGLVVLEPTPSNFRDHLLFMNEQKSGLTPDYPSATWSASPNYSAGRTDYKYVLIHTTQGSYAGTVSWFKNSASQVSAHYVVKSSDGAITQMVEHRNTAWHAQCYNSHSVGIEHEGYISDPSWYTEAMYNASAKLTRWIADKHGIPRDRSHIIGHNEVPASCNTNGHTDPGPNWNWTKYMNLVNGTTPSGTTGDLKGAIYVDPDLNNRIAGATATVTGNGVNKSMTVGTDGMYSFTLPVGTYTVTASKTGYQSASLQRAVTAGTTVWGSVGLKPAAAAKGNYKGTVYVVNDANPSDMTNVVSGAEVTLSDGQKYTTGANGIFTFAAAPGTYTATATKSGYQSGSSTKTVTSGADIWGSIGLRPVQTADKTPPDVKIDSPADMATFDIARVSIKGSATDNAGALAKVQIAVGAASPFDAPVTNGRFDFEVKLAPGANTVTVKGSDAAGNSDSAKVVLFFRSGVSGFAYQDGDESKRVGGATVTLWNGTTKLDQATSDAVDGSFRLDAEPGDYVLKVALAGFVTSEETVTVGPDDRVKVKIPMQPGSDAQPQVIIQTPENGATVDASPVTVSGVVTGFDPTKVVVNDVEAQLGAEGTFSASVPLPDADNLITVVATDATGKTAQATVEVKFTGETGPATPEPTEQQPDPSSGGATAPKSGACGCSASDAPALLVAAFLPLVLMRRRRAA